MKSSVNTPCCHYERVNGFALNRAQFPGYSFRFSALAEGDAEIKRSACECVCVGCS